MNRILNQEQLIIRCKKNDRNAQSELFKRYKDTLYLTSLKYCRNTVEAEDNLHDAFMAIFNSINKYKYKGSFEGWMKRITMFKAIDRYKNNKYIPVDTFQETLTHYEDQNFIESISLDQLLNCIQQLPDQYRLVFNLYQLDGYSHKEVASILNISEGTSKSNLHRAKLILQKEVDAIKSISKKYQYGS